MQKHSYCIGQERRAPLRVFLVRPCVSHQPPCSCQPTLPNGIQDETGRSTGQFPSVQYQIFAAFFKKVSSKDPSQFMEAAVCLPGDGAKQSQRLSTLHVLGQRVTPAKEAVILFHGKPSHNQCLDLRNLIFLSPSNLPCSPWLSWLACKGLNRGILTRLT